MRNQEYDNRFEKTMVNEENVPQQVKSILKTKNSKREEKLRAKDHQMQTHRKNGSHVEIEINEADKKKNKVKDDLFKYNSTHGLTAGSQAKNQKGGNSLKDLLANGIDDDIDLMDISLNDRNKQCGDLMIPTNRQISQKLDASPLEM